MGTKSLAAHHARLLKEYLECWCAPEAERPNVTPEVAAYHILEHASELLAEDISGDRRHALLACLQTDCRQLVLAACRYVMGVNLLSKARRLVPSMMLHSEEGVALLMRRDAVNGVLTLGTTLVRDLVWTDDMVRNSLARARCLMAELDDILCGSTHPEVDDV